MNPAVYRLPYDPIGDLDPVAMIATNPNRIVARKTLLANNLTELIAWLKAHPGQAAQGAGGIGTPAHVNGELFRQMIGTKFQFVPYRGAAPAMQDLVAGQIDMMFDQFANSLPQVRAGAIKAFAVTAQERSSLAPDVDEAGLPGLYVDVWHGMWVPKGTPKEIIGKLNGAIVEAPADPKVRQRFVRAGDPAARPADPGGPRRVSKGEAEKW